MKRSIHVWIIFISASLLGCDGVSVANSVTGLKNGDTPILNHDNTISGADVDGNGVRDDIDSYIASIPDTTAQKSALAQVSAALTNAMLVDETNPASLNAAMGKIVNSVSCVNSRYNTETNFSSGTDKRHLIRKLTINTKIRFLAYERFNAAMSGKTFRLPQDSGCVIKTSKVELKQNGDKQ